MVFNTLAALNKKRIIFLTALLIACSLATYLLYASGVFDFFADKQRVLDFIKENGTYASFVFIGLQAFQVLAAPIPGEVTGFVGGVLFGTVLGIVYSTIGLTIGSWIAFRLARLIGRPLIERFLKQETIRRYDYIMKHRGRFLAFLMFLIPGFPKDYLCYLLGLGHMGQLDFLIVSASGRLLGTSLLTIGGSLFRAQNYRGLFTLIGIGLAAVLFSMIYRQDIEHWFRKRQTTHRPGTGTDRAEREKQKPKSP